TVTYTFFKGLSCTPGAGNAKDRKTDEEANTQDRTVPKTDNHGPLGAGDYSFQASYSGNADYNTKTSDCEPFSVNTPTPRLTQTIKDAADDTTIPVTDPPTSVALGTTAYDTSSLAGQVDSKSFDGTATVTYTFFKGLSCTPGAGNANVIDTDQVTVAQDGTVPKSDNHGPLGAGDYSFQASYSGNADYNTKTDRKSVV